VSVDTRLAAEVQVLLEGVPLPAHKRDLVEYPRSQDPDTARELESLPDREYRSLDEVGKALAPVQPSRSQPDAAVPREESGEPPGGDAYVTSDSELGAVRHDAPSNPPQKALETQTQAQKEQQQRQQEQLP
jgi:Protein of unknown function (DUF2795)